MLWLPPPVALLPLQSPEARQDDGLLVVVHERVLLEPTKTDVGLAVKLTTGAPGGGSREVTVTDAESESKPLIFEHVRVKL